MLSRSLEHEVADTLSVGGAVTEITSTIDDLNRRLEISSAQLFRQARWEAQLFQSELLADFFLYQSVETLAPDGSQNPNKTRVGPVLNDRGVYLPAAPCFSFSRT